MSVCQLFSIFNFIIVSNLYVDFPCYGGWKDDITQCDDGGVITHSDDGRNSQHDVNIDVKEQFHERKNSAAGHQLKETSSENVSISCSPVLAEGGKYLTKIYLCFLYEQVHWSICLASFPITSVDIM